MVAQLPATLLRCVLISIYSFALLHANTVLAVQVAAHTCRILLVWSSCLSLYIQNHAPAASLYNFLFNAWGAILDDHAPLAVQPPWFIIGLHI